MKPLLKPETVERLLRHPPERLEKILREAGRVLAKHVMRRIEAQKQQPTPKPEKKPGG